MFSKARTLMIVGKRFAMPRVTAISTKNLSSIVSIETANAMPKTYAQMPNDILLTMAVMGKLNHSICIVFHWVLILIP